MWAALMAGLSYDRYGAQGGDFGSTISVWLARHHADHVAGLHLNLLPGALRPTPESLAIRPYGAAELTWLDEMARFADQEGSYAHQHRTKPQTLGFALNDSPAGLAAWIAEKFRAWSDCGGVIERAVSRDALLTNISIYWFTETITSSMRLYRETLSQPPQFDDGDRAPPPFGFAVFPAEIGHPPRELAERFFHIARWTEMPRGGHFAALEQPELLAHELREFFRPLRRAG
jgi:pimeloyl-ACP methyl ester carboxylesterase